MRTVSAISVLFLLISCKENVPPSVFRDTTPGVAGFGVDGIPLFGVLSIDLSSSCETGGWVNEDLDDDIAMAPVHAATISVEWSPEGFPIDVGTPVVSTLSSCFTFPADLPTAPTEGFFVLRPFNLDRTGFTDPDTIAAIANEPYSISCNGTEMRSGFAVANALITPQEIADKKPLVLERLGLPPTPSGAETYMESIYQPCGDNASECTITSLQGAADDTPVLAVPEPPPTDPSCVQNEVDVPDPT